MEYKINSITFKSDNLSMKSLEENKWLISQVMGNNESELKLNIVLNGISYKAENGKIIFGDYLEMEYPYIEDFNGLKKENCYYDCKEKDGMLELVFNKDQLNSKRYVYPVFVKTVINETPSETNTGISLKTKSKRQVIETKETSETEEINDYTSDVTYNVENKEILVRKLVARFTELLLKYTGEEINHDDFKETVYRERACKSVKETNDKNVYDAFVYLISDYKNPLTAGRLKKFIYLVSDKVINDDTAVNIVSKYFLLKDESVKARMKGLYEYSMEELKNELSDKENKIITIMLMNYAFVNASYPCAVFYKRDYDLLDKGDIDGFIDNMINGKYYQDKNYYSKLKEIHYEDIERIILENKEVFEKEYKVKEIYVFGSFSKGKERLDSDIDLFIRFNLDITSEELEKSKSEICKLMLEKLSRHTDITELVCGIDDELLMEMQKAKKVF